MKTQAERLRWGVLGVAKINQRLFPAFRKARRAQLVGLASRSLDRARVAATDAGIPRAFGSYEDLLNDPGIDAVYIPLPNTLHDEWTRKAADRGKHVLCEKPLTPTATEAARLVEYCRSKRIQLMDGFMWPHHPRTARIRQILDRGNLGPIRRVTGAFTFPLQPLSAENIRLHPGLAGGSLLDVGCYPAFGIRWAFGKEPVKAFASATYVHGVDVELSGLLWFADGSMASMDCGFTGPLRGWLEICGQDGVIFISDLWQPEPRSAFTVQREGKAAEVVTLEEADQITCMLDDFSSAVLEGRPVWPVAHEAVRTLRVLDALAASARAQAPVAVERE